MYRALLLILMSCWLILSLGCGDGEAGPAPIQNVATDAGTTADACGAACDEEDAALLEQLAPGTLVSEFSKPELIEFCELRKTFLSDFMSLQTDPSLHCTKEGLDAKYNGDGEVSTCEAARDACLEEAVTTDEDPFNLLPCSPFQVSTLRMADCHISLEEFDACAESMMTGTQDLLDSMQCTNEIGGAAFIPPPNDVSIPEECAPITERCPPIQAELLDPKAE